MSTELYLFRHGNTFLPGEEPRRIGVTDLPLVPSGIEQFEQLAKHLKAKEISFAAIYCAKLKRSHKSAEVLAAGLGLSDNRLIIDDRFNEVDCGIDDGKPESEIRARLGDEAIRAWDENFVVPDGWNVKPDLIKEQWQEFLKLLTSDYEDQKVAVITSGGIGRFALTFATNFSHFKEEHGIKIKTGSYGVMKHGADGWVIESLSLRP